MVPRGHTGQAKPRTASCTSPLEAIITERTALIGGGATGIGFAIAARLAPTHRVVITGRRAERLEKAAAMLRERTGAAVGTLVSDIAAPDTAAAAMDAMTASYGSPDVLVLNAGGPPPGRILDVADDAWRAGAELLLLGPLRLARLALPGMASRGFGRLVFVTSTAVRQPQPDLAISVVLRAAVTAAAKLLSREYAADGVTVNCVAPGATDTQRRREVLAARAARIGRQSPSWTRRTRRKSGRAAGHAGRDRRGGRVPGLGGRRLCQRDRAHGRRRKDGNVLMGLSGPGFDMADFLGAISACVRPGTARPVVVHAAELETLPAAQVHNPTTLAIAGRLPTATFELFRQTIPPGQSSDMQRHYHETVHYVISGHGHSEIEDETRGWAVGDFIYTPPWTWHRHYNDSAGEPVEFLTIENSRLLQALGITRRQSAGLCTVAEARARFPEDQS